MSSTFGKGRKKSNTCQTLYEVSTVKSLLKEPSQDTIPTVRLQVFFFFRFDLWIDANLISWQEWIEFIFVEDPTRKHLGVRNLLEQSSTEQTSLQTWLEMQRSNSILTFYFRIVRNRTCDSSGMLKDLRNWLKMTCTSGDVWCLAETFRFKLCVQEVSTTNQLHVWTAESPKEHHVVSLALGSLVYLSYTQQFIAPLAPL